MSQSPSTAHFLSQPSSSSSSGPTEIHKADETWPVAAQLEAKRMESSRIVLANHNKLISSEPLYIWVFALMMALEVVKTPGSCYLKRFLKVFMEKNK